LIIFSGTPFLFMNEILVDGAAKLDDNYFWPVGVLFCQGIYCSHIGIQLVTDESPLPSA